MQTRTSSTSLQLILIVLSVLFVFFMYAFLHETGHVITGLFFGQTLTDFSVRFWDFSAHVAMTGGNLNPAQLAVQAIAGLSLPLLIWAVFISLVPRKATFTMEVLKLLSSMTVINTLIAWIILPLLFLLGKAPSDDVTNFLRNSQMPPLLLTFAATILYIGGWALFLSKIDNFRNGFLMFRTVDRETVTAGMSRTIPAIVSILVFSLILTSMLKFLAAADPTDRFSPPQGFVSVAQIDLSTHPYSAETLTEFTLEKPTYVGVFIAVNNINTTYFDLSLIGPGGYNSTVLHGEGYRADQDGGLWEETLSPGTYQLVLTSHRSPGTASVYLRNH